MRHVMGSRYFFGSYPDFKSHDFDFVEVLTTNEFLKKRVIRGQGKDIIQLRRKPKRELIEDALNEPLPMVVGKFLIPEFCAEIGFTIEDLPKIKPLLDKIDEKHSYELIIYESYLENGSFTLTEEQRLKAYECYKKYRPDYYKR